MKLTIESLGPITKGTIDLSKSLTIITGPNNSGKSYLTYLIHGISQYSTLSGFTHTRNELSKIFSKEPFINNLIESNTDIDLSEVLSEKFSEIISVLVKGTEDNLTKIFASSKIQPKITIENKQVSFTKDNNSVQFFNIKNNKFNLITYDGTHHTTDYDSGSEDAKERMITLLYVMALFIIETFVQKRTYFFPAERTAINLFAEHITSTKAELKDDLDSEIISGKSPIELVDFIKNQVKSAPKYPYAIRDYIQFVNNFKIEEKESEYAHIALDLESALTNGRISLNELNQIQFFPNDSSTPLELHLTSSLVKSLSYLILYLRYTAKKNDRIIIDEPELNLHPDLQISLAKIIAQMINSGLKVIISTHSDYLIKQINNLILLGELSKSNTHDDFIESHKYKHNDILIKDHIQAYFIHKGEINHINLNENGLVIPTINEAINQVDGLAEELFIETEG